MENSTQVSSPEQDGIPRRRTRTRLGFLVAVLLVSGCLSGPSDVPDPERILDRETFIEALLELRMGALDNAAWEMRVSERDSILSARDLTAEDIEDFVEFHGRDVIYMRDLWADMDALLLELLDPPADSTSSEG